MESLTDYRTLSTVYSKTKNELDEAKTSLSKLLGNQGNQYNASSRYKTQPDVSLGRYNLRTQQTSARQSRLSNSPESPEESPSDEELPSKKAVLQSAVVAKVGSIKSRKDVISKQNSNLNLQSRNRRMLGMVLNTLQKFQHEEIKRQPQDLKRIKVLEKVEAAEEEERELVKRQKKELFFKTKEKESELKCLEEMMKVTESFELWEKNQKYLFNYIVTKAEPRICFLPTSSTPRTKKHLERSREEIKENIEKRKADMEVTLIKIKESYQLLTPVSTEEKTAANVNVDNSQKELDQVTETYATEKEEKLTEETLNLDLSDDEPDFVMNMLY